MSKSEAEPSRLRAENEKLKALLATHGIAVPGNLIDESATVPPRSTRTSPLTPEAKVKLFRRLFHGRDDIYPIRWESKQTGKVGYSPVCANEWRSGVCEKPRIKCAECKHSLYTPVTDQVIVRHLKGEITAGVYPVLADDRCRFLAIDFDDDDWREDSRAVLQTCLQN